jgi:hypothetical protein
MFSMVHFDEPKKLQKFEKRWKHHILWHPTPPFPAWFTNLRNDDYELIDSMGLKVAREWLARDKTVLPTITIATAAVASPSAGVAATAHKSRRWSI